MVGGQVEDLEATGQAPDGGRLERIHRAKTGALLTAAVELGAVLAGVAYDSRRTFVNLGRDLGLLFQIADDILDVTGSATSLGKSPGKDAAMGKMTYPAVYGMDAAIAKRDHLAATLIQAAAEIEGPEGVFASLVDFVARRDR
jgi:geranylgeranyl diphosphate synthase, type II